MKSIGPQLSVGKKRTYVQAFECQEEKDSINCQISKKYLELITRHTKRLRLESAMHECLPDTNVPIYNAKSNTSNMHIPTSKSFQTSGLDSIGKDPSFAPFWSEFTKTVSTHSWLCSKIDCVDSDSSYWNGFAKGIPLNSWFTVKPTTAKMIMDQYRPNSQTLLKNWPKTYSRWSQYLSLNIMEKEQEQIENEEKKSNNKKKQKKKTVRRIKKVLLHPTREQKQVLNRWFGAFRYIYNKCVNFHRTEKEKYNEAMSKRKLFRNLFIKRNSPECKESSWLKEIPFDIIDEASIDFIKALNSTFARQKGNPFEMHFKSKKRSFQESIVIHKKHWKNGKMHIRAFGKDPIIGAELLPDTLESDTRLIKTKTGKYYLHLIVEKPMVKCSETQRTNSPTVFSMDPGVRTFMTGYDPRGYSFEWGAGDMNRLYRLALHIDKLTSKRTKVKHKKRYRLNKAIMRIRVRMKNLVSEIHRQLAKWLVQNYSIILLPSFEVSNMVVNKNGKRKIHSTTVRKMLTWSHYKFKQLLLAKSEEYPSCKVLIVDEHFTSKACGNCGKLNNVLGSSKTFVCPNCSSCFDRDLNAARNIWLRWIYYETLKHQNKMKIEKLV